MCWFVLFSFSFFFFFCLCEGGLVPRGGHRWGARDSSPEALLKEVRRGRSQDIWRKKKKRMLKRCCFDVFFDDDDEGEKEKMFLISSCDITRACVQSRR